MKRAGATGRRMVALIMDNNKDSRTGVQAAANTAQLARAATRIIRAAMTAGTKGAAIAAVKETAPLIIKAAAFILGIFVLFPLLVFVSLPNIFFGFDSVATENIAQMTAQALDIGSAYMNLEDFQRSQMDSIVTRLVEEYEGSGVSIDKIDIVSSLSEEDLCWLISINSVAKQQNLSAMSVEDIQKLSISHITYAPSLTQIVTDVGDTAFTTTTLTVDFGALDPQVFMDELAFDEDAKNWAKLLFNTLFTSDAFDEYGDYFSGKTPSYSGDAGYSGSYQHGSGYSNEIDISGFISPDTKNNLDLAAYAMQAYENNWGYVWGTYGNVLTESLFEHKKKQYPNGVGNYADFIEENWLGRRTTDCVGLIKSYGWLDPDTLKIGYAENGMPDYGANQMHLAATVHGTMDTMPDVPGLVVWKNEHVGVYVGNGMVVEAMGTKYGVVMTELNGRGWEEWCEIKYINYI